MECTVWFQVVGNGSPYNGTAQLFCRNPGCNQPQYHNDMGHKPDIPTNSQDMVEKLYFHSIHLKLQPCKLRMIFMVLVAIKVTQV